MVVSCRITVLATCLLIFSVQIGICSDKGNNVTLLPFLTYVSGQLGEQFTQKMPLLLLVPVILVPPVKNFQDTSKSIIDENKERIDYHTHNISYFNVSSNFTSDNDNNEPNNVTVRNYPIKKLRESDDEIMGSVDQNTVNNSNTFESVESSDNENMTSVTEEPYSETEHLAINNMTTKGTGPYPPASYNNAILKNLTLTMQQIDNNLALPNTENKWKNFSLPLDNSNDNRTSGRINGSATTDMAIFPMRQSTIITNIYPYPPAVSHSGVDELSITTNSHLDEGSNLPLSHDDRWQRFTSLRKFYPNSDFRPLSGLYYDGFLYKSINKKNGFIPYSKNN